MNDTDRNIFRYNISQNDLDLEVGAFHLVSGGGKLDVYNNVIYRSMSQNKSLTHGSNSGMAYYKNNIFYNAASSGYNTSAYISYDYNLFYGANAAAPNDPHKIIADPKFVNPGSATGRTTADGYKLQYDSPAINSGVSMTGNGGKDFYGNTLYNGVPDRGAYEAQPSSDTQAPAAPTNLTATAVSSSQIDLSWTSSTDNEGVTGYEIFRGGSLVGTTPNNSYRDSGLSASTAYSYYVKAYDAAGNRSANSTASGTTTLGSTMLFQDDYEDGDAAGWTAVSGTWSIATDGTKVYRQSSASGEAIVYAGTGTWTDYTYEAKVKLSSVNGNAGLVFRYADASNFYMFRLNDNGDKVELYKRVGGTLTLVASSAMTVNTEQFYTLKVIVEGNKIIGFVDGAEKLNWTNATTQLTSGKIGFRMSSTAASVDQILVSK